MPTFPIIDSHLHLWDTSLLRYPWLDDVPAINRTYLLNDFRQATAEIDIDAMVFVQCEAEFSVFEQEADWVAGQAKLDPRIKALVAWAPLELGQKARPALERLRRHSFLRGIRRIIQFEADMEFCLKRDFIEGVRLLADFDLSFDICIDYRHFPNAIRFVELLPEVRMILDHIGKPAIRDGGYQPWADHLRTLAKFPNVSCKISGVATEANHQTWVPSDLHRYIDVAIDAFGFDRILFAGDWPVATQAISYDAWVQLLDERFKGVPLSERRKFWRNNAIRIYKMGLDQ